MVNRRERETEPHGAARHCWSALSCERWGLLNAITLPTPFTKVGVVTNCSTLPSEGHNNKRSSDTTNEQSIEQIIICILICIGFGQGFVSVSLHGKPLT